VRDGADRVRCALVQLARGRIVEQHRCALADFGAPPRYENADEDRPIYFIARGERIRGFDVAELRAERVLLRQLNAFQKLEPAHAQHTQAITLLLIIYLFIISLFLYFSYFIYVFLTIYLFIYLFISFFIYYLCIIFYLFIYG